MSYIGKIGDVEYKDIGTYGTGGAGERFLIDATPGMRSNRIELYSAPGVQGQGVKDHGFRAHDFVLIVHYIATNAAALLVDDETAWSGNLVTVETPDGNFENCLVQDVTVVERHATTGGVHILVVRIAVSQVRPNAS